MTTTTTGLPDRYRPLDQVAPDEETPTGVIRSWRARDRVLNRDVALRVHTPGGPAARQWITRALTAGGLSTPALAMVYDAAEGVGGAEPGGAAYVVNEWLEGTCLRDRLEQGGPLPEREACALVRRLAEGVAEAHRVGLAVGGLTPEHVVLRAGGLVGLLSVPAATGTVPGDIAALGALLELCLTGRTSDDGGSPPVITSPDLAALVRRARSEEPAHRLASAATMVVLLGERPRTGPQDQVRPEPVTDSGWLHRLRDRRDLADAAGGNNPPITEAHGIAVGPDAPVRANRIPLPPVPAASGVRPGAGRWPVADEDDDLDWGSTFQAPHGGAVVDDPPPPTARRRLAVIGLPLLALALVIAIGWWFGSSVLSVAGSVDRVRGSVPGGTATSTATTPPTPPTQSSAAAPAPVVGGAATVARASVFDPYGDGAPENDRQVPRSYDGDPSTAWSTLTYRGSADFGRLKPGVGVRYDLGSEQSLAGVRVQTDLPGATVEVRTGASPDGDLGSFAVAATGTLTGNDELTFTAPVTTRYVLVWVTGLVSTPDGFTADLTEVTPLAAG